MSADFGLRLRHVDAIAVNLDNIMVAADVIRTPFQQPQGRRPDTYRFQAAQGKSSIG